MSCSALPMHRKASSTLPILQRQSSSRWKRVSTSLAILTKRRCTATFSSSLTAGDATLLSCKHQMRVVGVFLFLCILSLLLCATLEKLAIRYDEMICLDSECNPYINNCASRVKFRIIEYLGIPKFLDPGYPAGSKTKSQCYCSGTILRIESIHSMHLIPYE